MSELGNKQIMAENIARYMKHKGIDRNELCADLNLKYSTVSEWLAGKKYPRIDSIEKMANYFGISKSDLIEKHESSNIAAVIDSDNIYRIPVFESVSAGFGAYASDEIQDYIPVVINNPYDVDDTIAIKVKGESMSPKIEDGDIIVVRKQTSVDSGDIAVVLLDGDEGLVKKVIYGDDWIELHSLNQKYKTQCFEGRDVLRLQVVGKVQQIIKML